MKNLTIFRPHSLLIALFLIISYSCNEDTLRDVVQDTALDAQTSQAHMNPDGAVDCIIEPDILPLRTKNMEDVGYVSITNDEEYLYVEYVAKEGWLIAETHLYVGAGEDVPLKKKGEPDKGKFPIKDKFDPGVSTYEYMIPLAELDDCFVVLAHAKVDNCEQLCDCDGKVTNLTMTYDGADEAVITVKQKKDGAVVFDEMVQPGAEFSFVGTDKGTLGTEIILYVDGVENTKIHTSCSQPIYIGMVSGDFTIVDGYSKNGGQLCTMDPPTNPDCNDCDGKVTNLTMTYDGADEAVITVMQKKDAGTVFDELVQPGAEFSFVGTDNGTLGTEITLYVDGVENTKIHTSCSQPIYIGMVSGDFTIVDGASKNGGQLCDTPPVDDKKGKKDKCKKESAWADGGITWEEYFDTKKWGYLGEYCVQECERKVDFTYAWEDLLNKGNDGDYNDLVVQSQVLKSPNTIVINLYAKARGAAYDHSFKIRVPEKGVANISGDQGVASDGGFFYITVFTSTKTALPAEGISPYAFAVNTVSTDPDCSPTASAQITLEINDDFVYDENVPYEPLITVWPSQVAGNGNSYDLYIYEVSGMSTWTKDGKEYPNGILIPSDWRWPLEKTNIASAYNGFTSITDGWNPNWSFDPPVETKVFLDCNN